jgi:hypothetical protein
MIIRAACVDLALPLAGVSPIKAGVVLSEAGPSEAGPSEAGPAFSASSAAGG